MNIPVIPRLLAVILVLPILALAGDREVFREDFESYPAGPWGDAAWRFFVCTMLLDAVRMEKVTAP